MSRNSTVPYGTKCSGAELASNNIHIYIHPGDKICALHCIALQFISSHLIPSHLISSHLISLQTQNKQNNVPYRPVSSFRSPRTISCLSMCAASSKPFTNSSKTGPDVGTERFASICARSCIRDSWTAWSSPRKSWIRARFKRRNPATVSLSLSCYVMLCYVMY